MAETKNTKPFYKTEIPSDWEVSSLFKISIDGISNGVFNDPQKVGKGYRLINVLDLYNEPSIDTATLRLLDIDENEFIKNKVKHGDIFFTRSSLKLEGIAFCNICLEDAGDITYDGHIMKVTPNKEILSPLFLRAYCVGAIARKYFMRNAKQNTMTTIGQSDIADLLIPIPPLPEQHAIAKVLSSMDKAINANNQLITQKEQRKKWLMQNLLTGKKRLKGFSGEWQEYHLGEMFAERNERNTEELPLLSIGQNGVYPQGESIKKDTSNADKSKYKKICIGDIGYNTMRMWQGRSALSSLEGIVSPAYTILKPRQNADSLFFPYLFKTPKLVNLFWRNSQGLVGDTLNCKYKDFSIVKATLPLRDEQNAIAKILQAADKEIDLLKSKTDKLKEQKKGMMQVLLTGKKRLNLNKDSL